MCTSTFVVKPPFSDEMENSDPVELTALLPFCYVSEEKLRTFLGCQNAPEPEILAEGTLVFVRTIFAENSSDLNAQAWALAAELQLTFGTPTPHVC